MKGRKTIKLVQAATGAIALTLLMQLMGVFGYGQYTWMCFLPLLMFFAFGADFKKIPEMLASYAVGEVWCVINSLVMSVFVSAFGADNMVMSNIVPTILVIFCILTTHENLLEGKICSNVPCVFMGLATSFFTFMLQQPINFGHLFAFWAFGIALAVCLVMSGTLVCSAIFGKERTIQALTPLDVLEAQQNHK